MNTLTPELLCSIYEHLSFEEKQTWMCTSWLCQMAVSDEEYLDVSGNKPSRNYTSVKDVLAHAIHHKRDNVVKQLCRRELMGDSDDCIDTYKLFRKLHKRNNTAYVEGVLDADIFEDYSIGSAQECIVVGDINGLKENYTRELLKKGKVDLYEFAMCIDLEELGDWLQQL